MSGYESLIGQAIMGNDSDKEKSMHRITCKMVASQKMFCGCGQILDQKDICVLETHDNDKTLAACCSKCGKVMDKKYGVHTELQDKYCWVTWDGKKELGQLNKGAK